MKNIFKFMGIALMACSLVMVSCKKDDSSDDNNGGGNTPGGDTTTGSIAVSWDGAAQTIQYTNASTDTEALQSGTPVYMIEAAKGLANDDYVFPAFITYFINGSQFGHATEYNITDQNGEHNGNYFFPTEAYIDGGIEMELQSGETIVFGDYQLKNCTVQSESFDATKMAITASLNCNMYDYQYYSDEYDAIYAAYVAEEMTLEEAQAAIAALQQNLPTKAMVMTITNFKVN